MVSEKPLPSDLLRHLWFQTSSTQSLESSHSQEETVHDTLAWGPEGAILKDEYQRPPKTMQKREAVSVGPGLETVLPPKQQQGSHIEGLSSQTSVQKKLRKSWSQI